MIACLLSGDARNRRPEYSIIDLDFAPCPASGQGAFLYVCRYLYFPLSFPSKVFLPVWVERRFKFSPPCVSRKGNIGGSAEGEWLRKGGGQKIQRKKKESRLFHANIKGVTSSTR